MIIEKRITGQKIQSIVLFLLLFLSVNNVYSKVEKQYNHLNFYTSGTDLIIVAKGLVNINNYVESDIPDKQKISYHQLLQNTSGIKTIQLFTHGKSGELYVNNKWVTSSWLIDFVRSIPFDSLNHLNILGCNFGKGNKGITAVHLLKEKLNISVSASSNITGALGDWVLEVGDYYELKNYPKNTAINLQDTDNDGILDEDDLDDDNDGILDTVEGTLCNFENGSRSLGHNVREGAEPYGNGCQSGNGRTNQWDTGFYSENDRNEVFSAFWEINVSPGTPFTITARVESASPSLANNGISRGTFQIVNDPASNLFVNNTGNNFGGATGTETFIPTVNTLTLRFDFTMQRTNFDCGARDLPEIRCSFNFERQLVPGTCPEYDFDQDGIPNHLDLDSDNDGCNDVVESGGVDVNMDGVLDGVRFDNKGRVIGGTGGYDGASGDEKKATLIRIKEQPKNATVCEEQNTSFNLETALLHTTTYRGTAPNTFPDYSASNEITTGFSYQWQVQESGSGDWLDLSNNAVYSGVTSKKLSLSSTSLELNNNKYRAKIRNVDFYCEEISSEARLLVRRNPKGMETNEIICSGDRLSKNLNTTVDLSGVSFSWQGNDNVNVTGETLETTNTNSINDVLINKSGAPRNVRYTITPTSASGCVGESYRYVVTVNPEPVGVETTDVICSGDRLSKNLNATVDVSGVSFTWEASENSNVTGETLVSTSANEITDTIVNKSGVVQEVVYTITPRSNLGCVGESYRYVVRVNPEPVGVETTDIICSGDRLSKDLSTTVDLTGGSFTWEAAENNDVTGETTTAMSAANITDTLVNKSGVVQEIVYTITPRSAIGCLGESYRYVVTVNPEPVGVETTDIICSGDRLSKDLTRDVDLTGVSFTWQASENDDVTGETTTVMSTTNITDTLVNTSGVIQEVTYTITPRSALGCLGASYRYVVTVNPEPVGLETTDVICSSDPLSKDLSGTVDLAGASFTWEAAENSNVTGETITTKSTSEITDTLVNKSGIVQAVVYTITPRSALGCLGASYRYVVTVNPEPVGVETTDVICSGDRLSKDLSGTVDLAGASFTWEAVENTNVTGETVNAISANEITDTLVNKSGVVQEVAYTITPRSALGCLGASYRYVVTVNPEPVGEETTDVICSGDRLSKDLSESVDLSGASFTWEAAENSNVTGETITTKSTSEITDTLVNKSSTVQEVAYTITPRSALGCLGASYRYVVTVNPEPVGAETTDVICSGDPLSKDLSGTVDLAGASFTWEAAENSNVTGETVTAIGTSEIADTLVNTSGIVQEVVYTIIPRSALGCLGASYRYVVTVNPEPVGEETTDVTCSGDRLSKDLSTTVDLAGASFTWEAAENTNVTGETVSAISANEITDTLVNKSGTVQEVVYTITPRSALGCLGASYRYVVTVNPEPVGEETTDVICSGDRLSNDLNTAIDLTGVSFTWEAAENSNVAGETTSATSTSEITDTLVNKSGIIQEVVYTITPRSALGCLGASYRYVVTVNPEPVGVETTDVICSGDPLSKDLSGTVDLAGASFTWEAAENSNVTGETVTAIGTSEITDTLVNTSGIVQEVVYTIIPRSALGCLGASYRYVVTVNPEPVGEEIMDVICSGDRLSKGLSGTVDLAGASFTWEVAENTNVTGETVSSISTNEITDTLVNKSGVVQEMVYTITPRSALGCLGASYRYVVTVNPEPVGEETTDVICSGDRLSNDLNTAIDLTGVSFIWEAAENTNVTGETITATSTSEITDTLVNKSSTVQEVVYTITPRSALGCLGASYRYVVTVNPEPVGLETTDVICSGDSLSKDLSATVDLAGASFTWEAAENSNVTGETPTATSGTEITDTLVNKSGVVQEVVYTITPRSALGCLGVSYRYVVTVNPEPVGVDTTEAICSGDSLSKDLANDIDLSGASFTWEAEDNSNIEGITLGQTTTATITDTLINSSASIQEVIYRITPQSSEGCIGASFTYTVQVSPENYVTEVLNTTISNGENVNYDLLSDVLPEDTEFSWVADSNDFIEGESTDLMEGNMITDTLTNTSTNDQVVRYVIHPKSSIGCEGVSYVLLVTIKTKCFTIYNEFSPDQDGQNDTFTITCIEEYPNNTLEVFNRWGNTVYKKQGYKNEWDGSSEGRSTIAAESGLPAGTYYYVIDLGNGEDAKVGWLYVNRK
ncbi:PKD-like domain-containing protein [Tenacibaculum sp. MAR_2009_124]|uniref:PKD-like domain-containing protein n=1 Tax=Tenacibaculum sp. MAR_2009_124 TaxID=1250059 RepID=UPI0015A40D6B|nr:PKD-like domain-containing protein [Tenacibaculum sp. MAR_2009_124]